MINLYAIALFLHVVGALGLFVAFGIDWMAVQHLRRAETVEQVRLWMRASGGAGRIGTIGMVVLLLSGIYMAVTVWGMVPWIGVTLGAFPVMAVLMMVLTRPRMVAIGQAIQPETVRGPVSPELVKLLRHPLLRLGVQLRATMVLGIVYLMTVKPGFIGSLYVMGVALLIGVVISLVMPGREQPAVEPAL